MDYVLASKLISGYRINLESGEQTVLSAHTAPVKSVVYSKEHCRTSPLPTKAQF